MRQVATKYLVKRRDSLGIGAPLRQAFGGKPKMRWSRWLTLWRCDTIEEARTKMSNAKGGLCEWAIFHRGKVLERRG